MKSSRRKFLAHSMALTLPMIAPFSPDDSGLIPDDLLAELKQGIANNRIDKDAFKISLFTKHVQWLDFTSLAKLLKETGFDGADLPVRKGGHILPENVERDLPLAMAAMKKEGLDIHFISTDIQDADDPLTERVLKTASSLGIKHYRMQYYYYDQTLSVDQNLKVFEQKMKKLAALNKRYKIIGEYQNHSQDQATFFDKTYFGATLWDLYLVLRKINSPWLCSQFDIGHATVESYRSWVVGLELLAPFMSSLHVKDFSYQKQDKGWEVKMEQMGDGMVNYPLLFEILKKKKIQVPITFYYGYDIGDVAKGPDIISIKNGLEAFKKMLKIWTS